MRLTFFLPAGSDAVSGGNIYNDQLIRALRALTPVDVHPIDDARRELGRRQPGVYVFDTLNLRELVRLPPPAAGQRLLLLLHHLPSLEPGIAPVDPALAIESAALARCQGFIATSPFTTRLLQSRGFSRDTIVTLTPGRLQADVNPRPYTPPLRALMVGNLIPRKGIRELLEALAPRVTDSDAFTLEIAGRTDLDPDYAGRCRAVVEGTPPLHPRVQLHGPVPFTEMHRHYQAATLLVSAAQMETYGMALAEAIAHGLPILALDRGHVGSHLADGHPGQLVEAIPALAEALLRLVREPLAMSALFAEAQRRPRDVLPTWADQAQIFLNQLARA